MWGPRAKLTAWYAGIFLVVIVVLAIAVAATLESRLDSTISDALDRAVGVVIEDESVVPRSTADARSEEWLDVVQRVPSAIFIVVTDESGRVIANPRGVSTREVGVTEQVERLAERDPDDEGSPARVPGTGGDEGFSLLSVRIENGAEGEESLLLHVGQSLDTRNELVDELFVTAAVVGLIGIVLVLVGGYFLAGRTLRPINQSLEEQRRFASDASHELRTPLSVIRMNAEILEMHRDDRVEDQMESVETIIEETDRVTRLVGSLLTLARTDEGQLDLATETLELGELVTETVDDLEPLGALRGVKVEAFAERVMVSVDRERVKQLIAILVDNGVKYTPEGGTVTVLVRQGGTDAFIRVRDTGPGIPAEDRERVFDRFYRVDKARSREAGGSGLGLSIAKWIAEIHGGSIRAELAPSGGAEIVVRLPRE